MELQKVSSLMDYLSCYYTQFELAYYRCDSVIPVVIPSKLKISFQARKSPGAFLPLSQLILVRFSNFFFFLKVMKRAIKNKPRPWS